MEQNIKDWMCLLWEESRYEKNVTGHRNDDGSWDYGPFQCSEKWFCRGEHWGNFHFLKKKNKNQNILNEYMSYEYLSIFCYYPKYILRTYQTAILKDNV